MPSYGTVSTTVVSSSNSTDNNLSSNSNSPLPLSNSPNSNTENGANKNVQPSFDVQQGLPLSKTIGIYDLPKNIILTDDFGKNNKIAIRAFFLKV